MRYVSKLFLTALCVGLVLGGIYQAWTGGNPPISDISQFLVVISLLIAIAIIFVIGKLTVRPGGDDQASGP